MITLRQYQKIAIEYIKNNYGLIVYHSTGSGKTIIALVAMNQFNRDTIIIGPKSSMKVFNDTINKLEYDNSHIITIYSMN